MTQFIRIFRSGGSLISLLLMVTVVIYWPGLRGAWLFDDYPNIVDNHGVQPSSASLSSLVGAALSSPASDFKRPLSSLSFAANYLLTGLDPYWMKFTNLIIHLLNGLAAFVLIRQLLVATTRTKPSPNQDNQAAIAAAFVAGGWLLLPINLTSVLYVVQRMESLANLFVLTGLIGYVAGRRLMLDGRRYRTGVILSTASLVIPTAIGLMAKETAVMLPLYAASVEWIVFRFRQVTGQYDRWIVGCFLILLALPLVVGLTWILPGLLKPSSWGTRDFTLETRLLSEARIIPSYILWAILPTPKALSFYHDNFSISTGLFSPWTTSLGLFSLLVLGALSIGLRRRQPIIALGLQFFLSCHLLTGTVLPLELIYEHRNYFASLGLMLVVVPILCATTPHLDKSLTLARHTTLGMLLLFWGGLTAITAQAWSTPLRLAEELAARAPDSPRAQYELGRTYVIYSHYDPSSAFTKLAYAPLEKAAALPGSSILPEQALIFMNSRMQVPLKDSWWDSMTAKLRKHPLGVQDESSLGALVQCARVGQCELPKDRMTAAFLAALTHRPASARLLATYADYAWNVLQDHSLGMQMAQEAAATSPDEPAYLITLAKMLLAEGRKAEAQRILLALERLNFGGRLDSSIADIRAHLP